MSLVTQILSLFFCLLTAVSAQFIDEIQTGDPHCLHNDHFLCASGQCIASFTVCDGYEDCIDDGTDELNCPFPIKVNSTACEKEHKAMCSDRTMCIPFMYICNGVQDCHDGSDEMECEHTLPLNSSCQGFKCKNGDCISHRWACDGTPDCLDSSDETQTSCSFRSSNPEFSVEFCPVSSNTSGPMFYCNDGSFCLNNYELCNGLHDCKHGEDEGAFCANWTTMCNNIHCEHGCKPTPVGPKCKCGDILINVKESCSNADHCAQLFSACSQICSNVNGTFKCSCEDGYLEHDENKCSVSEDIATLFYTTEEDIRSYTLNLNVNTILTKAMKPRRVRSDGNRVYWLQSFETNSNIMQASLNNIEETKEVFLSIGLSSPEDLAIDWLGRNLYFTDSQHNFIGVCTLNGSSCTRLRSKGINDPTVIALYPEKGVMYWADLLITPCIQRGNMDGTKIETLTLTRPYPPVALTLDIPNEKLYWVVRDDGLNVMNLRDNTEYKLHSEFIHIPNSLAVFENELFWHEHAATTLQSCSKLRGKANQKTLVNLTSRLTDLSVFHPVLMQEKSHGCMNNLCSDMCLLSGEHSYTCACPEGSTLEDNKYNCLKHEPEYYLAVAGGNNVTKIFFHTLAKPDREVITLDVTKIQAVAYNPFENVLYISDGLRRVVYKQNMDRLSDSLQEILPIKDATDIIDMGYDYITGNLYYLNFHYLMTSLEVYSISKEASSLLHTFMDGELALSLCVLPEYGTLIVAYFATTKIEIHVDRYSMDGKDRTRLYFTKFKRHQVTVHYSRYQDKVYITDPGNGVIYQMHPEGTNLEVFRKIDTSVESLAVVQNMVFWLEVYVPRLFWANSDDHSNTMGNMILNSYLKNVSRIHLLEVHKSKAKHSVKTDHVCLSNANNCSHICVQTRRTLANKNKLGSDNFYACLCPHGKVSTNNYCDDKVICVGNELSCYESNSCYKADLRCDGKVDCPRGEDEDNCQIDNTCPPKFYKCPLTMTCLERHKLCDGHEDCPDGSDEESHMCPQRPCHNNEYMCPNGLCIFKSWVCDGEADCMYGAEEDDCVNKTCNENQYQCHNGDCIDLHKRCDDLKDCLDWSDEDGCDDNDAIEDELASFAKEYEERCKSKEYLCPSNKGICLPYSARCNGKAECPKKEDEEGCGEFTCLPDYYQCKMWHYLETKCVPYDVVCDKKNDCLDGSDESGTACAMKSHHKYLPVNIAQSNNMTCDDGYLCDNKMCVDWKNVCNGVDDCSDGSDEGGLCSVACGKRKCDQICKSTPRGPRCSCHNGYSLAADDYTCNDINECTVNSEICSQICTNIIGSYLCSCYNGYARRVDGHSCKSPTGDVAIIYVTSKDVVSVHGRSGVNSVLYREIRNDTTLIDVAFDPRKKMLYVTTSTGLIAVSEDNKISKVKNIENPSRIAVDWVTSNVYLVDATLKNQSMWVCNIEKNACAKRHYIRNDMEIESLSVDPINRKMFYCGNVAPKNKTLIYMANLHDSDVTLFKEITVSCKGLTVDYNKRLLYVALANTTISKINYEGVTSHKAIETQDKKADTKNWISAVSFYLIKPSLGTSTPFGIQLFEDHIYYFDKTLEKISRCLIYGSKRCESYMFRILLANGFVMRHDELETAAAYDHCSAGRCGKDSCDRPECLCYGDKTEKPDDLCIGPYLEMQALKLDYSEIAPLLTSRNSWGTNLVTITAIIIFIIGGFMYLWRFKRERLINVCFPLRTCMDVTGIRRTDNTLVHETRRRTWQRYEHSLLSGQSSEPSDFSPEVVSSPEIVFHAPTPQTGRSNSSFVNWLYSSIIRRRRPNEATVSVHLAQPAQRGAEGATAKTETPVTASVATSDTESEIEGKYEI